MFLVGRSRRAHFQLPEKDEYFSRIHFMVEVNPPLCRLTDMGSKNGTYVNGQRVSSIDLKDGDVIQAGTSVLRLAMEPENEAGLPRDKPAPPADPGPEPPTAATGSMHKPESGAIPETAPHLLRPSANLCPACGAPILQTIAGASPSQAGISELCALCQQQASRQPQPISGFCIICELGRGGMGVVYLARRAADGMVVALKTIVPAVAATKVQVDRFLREARILQGLTHPNIVGFREMGESGGQLYFAMDYLRGTDAGRLLQAHGGPLPIRRAVNLVCQLLEALAYAHSRLFVHRDIKPQNMLVVAASGVGQHPGETVKLLDFGLARVYQSSQLSGLTMERDIGGTVPFMAPEQITHFRESKPTVDQYAAGATLYNLLTARHVYDFPQPTRRQIAMILQEDPVPILNRRPDLPPKLAEIIHCSLARDIKARFPDARAMRLALAEFA
jgi:serine/threonine-protein kinase